MAKVDHRVILGLDQHNLELTVTAVRIGGGPFSKSLSKVFGGQNSMKHFLSENRKRVWNNLHKGQFLHIWSVTRNLELILGYHGSGRGETWSM